LATLQCAHDIPSPGEVAEHDLRADGSQRISASIFAPDKRANWQAALTKYLDNSATNCAQPTGCACDKNGVFHVL
jgi:hypothetical protein